MTGTARTMRWGMPLTDWETAKTQAHDAIAERASRRSTITYGELCAAIRIARFKPHSWRLVALLDELCADQGAERGVTLATLVVRADSGRPGDGYFLAMERLGADASDREAAWQTEVERVWSAYGVG